MIKIREMDIVGRGLAGKRDKHNPQMRLSFSNIKNNLWRKRKSTPISVKHSVFIDLKKKKQFLSFIMKTISDVLKQDRFKGLNGIIGRHHGKDVIFINENHHFGFPIQSEEGHVAMIPFVNELSTVEINEHIKNAVSYAKKNESQWFYITGYEHLQLRKEKYFPTFAITDWHSIDVDGGFLPIGRFSGPPITFGYTKKEIFFIYDHLFFSGAIIGAFLNVIKEELKV